MEKGRINDIRKRALASWWEDGIVESVAGLGVLVVGGIGLLGHLLEGRIPPWSNALMVVVIVATAFAIRRAVLWAKGRWSWPYVGYAVVRGRNVRRILLAYAPVLALIGVAFVFPSYLPLVSGVIGGVILLSIALSYGPGRFYFLALLSVLLGVLFQVVGLEGERAAYTILVVLGAIEMVFGVSYFIKFRREVLEGER